MLQVGAMTAEWRVGADPSRGCSLNTSHWFGEKDKLRIEYAVTVGHEPIDYKVLFLTSTATCNQVVVVVPL